MRRFLNLSIALLLSVTLAACDTVEERAEGHYQSALTLLAEGDVDRAIVELRNVFPLVPNHLEARHELARILLVEKQATQQAYSQYLRLVEQYPDDLKALVELSKIAFFAGNWEEMTRHGGAARELDAADPRVQVLAVALDYRAGVEAEDSAALEAAVQTATALLDPVNPNRMLRELILDNLLRQNEFSDALAMLDDLSTEFPETQRYWRQRLQVLLAMNDQSAVEAQLLDLVDRFPEDLEQKQMLLRYFLSRGDIDKAESFLRDLVEKAPEGESGQRIDLIRFLAEVRTIDDARAEINDAIATETDTAPFVMLGSALDFTTGNAARAITDLEAAVSTAEPSDETNDMKVTLARMLGITGNEVGARSLVEAVLIDDGTHPGALKMNAAWLTQADDTDAAIAALRTALDANPEDPETLTLMANAYLRTGSKNLARDFLSLAVEASGNAPAETVRYAQMLISEDRFLPAEDILLPALRITPNNLELLQTTAQLYLRMDDIGRVRQVIDTLNRLETPQATQLAIQIEADRLNLASGADDAIAYLENLATGTDADLASRILLLRARISTGDSEGAIILAEQIIADEPDTPAMQLLYATTLASAGELDRALDIYLELAAEVPNEPSLQITIATMQQRNGDPDAARATIDAALDRAPNAPQLMWASASYLEQDGDIDGAIAVYEELYALDSNSMVVANNLASLVGTYRDDAESLDRAWTIARRFSDSELPAIQDTYGWITHRRGESEDALPYLQAAAAGLVDDPIVQFHLAEVLFALGRTEDALAQYRVSLDKAGIGDTRAQITKARDRIAELENTLATTE